MIAIAPVINSFTVVNLNGNEIGSYGGTLIASCLAKNPLLWSLCLEHNCLEDNDAKKLSIALQVRKKSGEPCTYATEL